MNNSSLKSNTIFFVLYRILNIAFPMITSSYVSHIIHASGIGKIASAQNIVQYFVLIAALGIPNYGTREIAKLHRCREERSTLFSELFLVNAISSLGCAIVFYCMIIGNNILFQDQKLYCVLGISIILNIFNVDWFYQGTEQYKYIMSRSFFVKIVSIIAIFIFVRDESDYLQYAMISIAGTAGNYLLNTVNLHKNGVRFTSQKLQLKRHFKPVVILLGTTISIELYTLLDTTMLTFFCASENVGYYTNSMRIVRMLITAITAVGGVLLPRLSYYYSHGNIKECGTIVSKIFTLMLFLFLPSGIGMMLLADSIMPVLFGSTFIPAVPTLRIAALLVYALGFSNLFGTQVLLTFNCEKKLLCATIVGALTNIFLNFLLIPRYYDIGAAFASIASELLVTCMTIYFSVKYIEIKLDKKSIGFMFFSVAIMVGVVMIIKMMVIGTLEEMIVSVIVGGSIYLGINILLKNPILMILKK